MKKTTKLIFAIAIIFGFIACGTQTKKEEAKEQKSEEVSTTPEKPSDDRPPFPPFQAANSRFPYRKH